jgi:hypothetical protein
MTKGEKSLWHIFFPSRSTSLARPSKKPSLISTGRCFEPSPCGRLFASRISAERSCFEISRIEKNASPEACSLSTWPPMSGGTTSSGLCGATTFFRSHFSQRRLNTSRLFARPFWHRQQVRDRNVSEARTNFRGSPRTTDAGALRLQNRQAEFSMSKGMACPRMHGDVAGSVRWVCKDADPRWESRLTPSKMKSRSCLRLSPQGL